MKLRHPAAPIVRQPAGAGKAGGTVRFGADVRLADMRLVPSGDGQCLLIYCRWRIVAIHGVMGSDVEAFEFADAGRLDALELMERIAPLAR